MVERFEIKISGGHIDGTSISVEGKYIQSEEKQKESCTEDVKEKEEKDEPVTIELLGNKLKKP